MSESLEETRTESLFRNKLLEILRKISGRHPFRMARKAIMTKYRGYLNRMIFRDIDVYCMFIGYPRSGHSLIGSIIDAHPNAIIALELDALKFVDIGFNREQIYSLILDNSKACAEAGRLWTGYSYAIPDSWAGEFRKLKVIGDKKGGKSTRRFKQKPALLQELVRTIEDKLKMIHVVRNPFDNISTLSRKHSMSIDQAIEFYFSLCKTNSLLIEKLDEETILTFRHEDLISNPHDTIKMLCRFVNLPILEDYVNKSAEIIFDSPKKRRHDAIWTENQKQKAMGGIKKYNFLVGYSFDS